MLTHYIAVGLGGALGAMLRVCFSKFLPFSLFGIPFPILFINILGCFVMGALVELMALHWSVSDNMRYFLLSGFLGGFTTFSAFALEFGLLYSKQQVVPAIIYAGLSFSLSIAGFFCGAKLVRVLL